MNTPFLPKSTTFYQKYLIPAKKPSSSKNVAIMAHKKNTNLAKNTHFLHKVVKSCQRKQILTNFYY